MNDVRSSMDPPIPTSAGGWMATGIGYGYQQGDRLAVNDLTASITPGACTAVLGPNGSGKSTLLRLLLGVLKPSAGNILLAGRPLMEWSRRELARMVGVVPQDEEISFPLTVRELVSMGRYARLGAFQSERVEDRAAVTAAMLRCDVSDLGHRPIQTLSGGERQRARLARALAQEPQILALDEPTRALDMRHEMEILELLRSVVAEGATVLLVTHNINLAARYADELLLLDAGRVVAHGTPAEVLRRDRVEAVYRWPVTVTPLGVPGPDAGAPQVTPLARGDRPSTFLTESESGGISQ